MYELHENEQYFYDEATIRHLTDLAQGYRNPCCLCTPLLGQELERRGRSARTLDMDTRFSHLNGFRAYNLYRPGYLNEEYDLIICDPPFYNVGLHQLFTAIRTLSRHRFEQPLLVSFLTRRADSILGTFIRYGLQATGYYPSYVTLQKVERNRIEFYGNLGEAELNRLRTNGH